MRALTPEQKSKSVILLQDTFTTLYEAELPLKIYDLLTMLGFTVYVAPLFPNGKTMQVKGFLSQFSRLVHKNTAYLTQLTTLDIPLVGIDPSITLTYRDEYQKVTGVNLGVQLPQEWLVTLLRKLPVKVNTDKETYYLLSHCTEKTACVAAEEQWQAIFAAFGCELKPLPAGCCGMAGAYGHEVEHVVLSRKLFEMDWQRHLGTHVTERVLATGYSCRSQAERFAGKKLSHPLEALYEYMMINKGNNAVIPAPAKSTQG